ncbi:MAG: serine protease [Candidatus Methanomethylicaceae archaeon]
MKIETPAEQLLYATVRIETEGLNPSEKGAGTAFIFGLEREKGTFLCLVTNKHVVRGAKLGRFFFTQRKNDGPDVGKRFDIVIDNFEQSWHGHPNAEIDIAAMPLVPLLDAIKQQGNEVFFRSLSQNLIPNEAQLAELDALEEILFIGYPSGMYDTANLLPVFRRGITATPIQVDYNRKPIFLIDASVFPGSSGSPVLIYNLGGYGSRKGFNVATRVLFLGIIAQVMYQEQEGALEFITIPTAKVPIVRTKQMIDLGVVFKARAVVETVEGLLGVLERKV